MTADLRNLAEKATPGPWRQGTNSKGYVYRVKPEDAPLLTGFNVRSEADAAYIAAANPTTVLALLDEIEALRKELGCD